MLNNTRRSSYQGSFFLPLVKSGGCYLAGFVDDNNDKVFIIVCRQKRMEYYLQKASMYGFEVESVCYPWDYGGKDLHYLDKL